MKWIGQMKRYAEFSSASQMSEMQTKLTGGRSGNSTTSRNSPPLLRRTFAGSRASSQHAFRAEKHSPGRFAGFVPSAPELV